MNFVSKASNIVRSAGDPKVIQSGASSLGGVDKLARCLGWFSLGLGLAEVIAPRTITRALGMEGAEGLVRAYGVRELAAGVMTLSPDKKVGLWSRLAGDGLDVATLLPALRDDNPKRANASWALLMVLGVTLCDYIGARGVAARHARRQDNNRHLYSDRSGFPKGLSAAKKAAEDFQVSSDMRARAGFGSNTGQYSPARP